MGHSPPAKELLAERWIERFQAVFGGLSYRGAQHLGQWLGKAAFLFPGRERKRALDHLELAFPEMPSRTRVGLARRVFEHFGMLLGETLWLLSHPVGCLWDVVDLEGFENFVCSLDPKKPTFLISGHCGHWELIHAAVSLRGIPVHALARDLDFSPLAKHLLDFRHRYGTRTIPRGSPSAGKALLYVLRNGGVLGFAIDQDTRVEGVWVPFFGRPAFTPVGPAEMAFRFDANVVSVFAERTYEGRHRIRFDAPLESISDPIAVTAALTSRIETQIRRHPEQWVWNHRRWRRQPEAVFSSVGRGSTSRAPKAPRT